MPQQDQDLATGAIGVQVAGDSNQINIHAVRDKLHVPAYLPYAIDRHPQMDQVRSGLSERDKPLCFACLCTHEDAAETFAIRMRRHVLDSKNLLSASVEFEPSGSADEMIGRWIRRLNLVLCKSAPASPQSKSPITPSTEQPWDRVVDYINQFQDSDVFISSVVERESVIKMPPQIWQQWQDEIVTRFAAVNKPGRIILYLAIVRPRPGLLGRFFSGRAETLVDQLLLPREQMNCRLLGEFGNISQGDCFDWAAEYFAPWYRDNVAGGDASTAEDDVELVKAEIRQTYGATEAMPLRPVGEAITDIIRRKIGS